MFRRRELCFLSEMGAPLRMLVWRSHMNFNDWQRFCLRSIITVFNTIMPLLFPLLRHNPLVTLYKPLHIGNFYPRHMIAWMCYSATVGYCFLLAQKYKIFSLVLTCWFVIVAFKTSRNPHTPTKYVAHYWLRLVMSINSSTSNWFTPSSTGNCVTFNHSLILSWKFNKFHVSSFWWLLFRGYFSLQFLLWVLALRCYFDKRFIMFLILTRISRS